MRRRRGERDDGPVTLVRIINELKRQRPGRWRVVDRVYVADELIPHVRPTGSMRVRLELARRGHVEAEADIKVGWGIQLIVDRQDGSFEAWAPLAPDARTFDLVHAVRRVVRHAWPDDVEREAWRRADRLEGERARMSHEMMSLRAKVLELERELERRPLLLPLLAAGGAP